MCRWLVYCGDTILLSDLLLSANHSLLKQALPNRQLYTPETEKSEFYDPVKHSIRNHITNGDGFGIAWYTHNETKGYSQAHVYKSILPAWNDKNLVSVCEGIRSDLIFGHIRAASAFSSISRENCHPFKWGSFSFMHNGGIGGFAKIKRKLQQLLSDEIFDHIEGTTDSEHAFALFLNFINPKLEVTKVFEPDEISLAVEKTIDMLIQLTKEANTGPSSLNFAVSDGYSVCCTRFRNCDREDPPSLYYSLGSEFIQDEKGEFSMKSDGEKDTIIISSEPLSSSGDANWKLIPRNTIITSYPYRAREEISSLSASVDGRLGASRGANFFGRESEIRPLGESPSSDELDTSLRHLTRPKGDNVALRVKLKELRC